MRNKQERYRKVSGIDEKFCTKCGEWKEMSEDFFNKHPKGKHGFQNPCKLCKTEKKHSGKRIIKNSQPVVASKKKYTKKQFNADIEEMRRDKEIDFEAHFTRNLYLKIKEILDDIDFDLNTRTDIKLTNKSIPELSDSLKVLSDVNNVINLQINKIKEENDYDK